MQIGSCPELIPPFYTAVINVFPRSSKLFLSDVVLVKFKLVFKGYDFLQHITLLARTRSFLLVRPFQIDLLFLRQVRPRYT